MATLSAITGTLRDLTGAVLPTTAITFTRDGVAGQDGSTIIPRAIVATSNALGAISVTLYSGNYSAMTIGADGGLISFDVAVPGTPTAVLSNLINAASIVYTPAAQSASEAAAAAALVSENNAAADAAAALVSENNAAATLAGAMIKTANLSDVVSVVTARSNLGLGSAALSATSAFVASGDAVATTDLNLALSNGWWSITNGLTGNAPSGAATGWLCRVESFSASNKTQVAFPPGITGASDSHLWRREMNASAWGAWYRIRATEAEIQALFPVATQLQAETGTDTATRMNPLRTAQAIAAQATSAVKAWVSFNGTGVVAINGQLNVSSVTDLGTGTYRINFATALANANYAATGTGTSWALTDPGGAGANIRSATQGSVAYYKTIFGIEFLFGSGSSSLRDPGEFSIIVCGA